MLVTWLVYLMLVTGLDYLMLVTGLVCLMLVQEHTASVQAESCLSMFSSVTSDDPEITLKVSMAFTVKISLCISSVPH